MSNYCDHLLEFQTLCKQEASEQLLFTADSDVTVAGQEVTGSVGSQKKKTRKAAARKLGSGKCRKLCETRRLPHVCSMCCQTFGSKFELVKHKCDRTLKVFDKRVGLRECKQHECDVCHKTVGSKAALCNHKRYEHEQSEVYVCEFCGKGIRLKNNFETHTWTHTGQKPFRCDVCDKAFNRSFNLSMHKRTVHDCEKPYKCGTCEKAFGHRSHLKSHVLIHTGFKPHKCDLCNKAFYEVSALKKHQFVHAGERPYKCAICDRDFTQKVSLAKHLNKHSLDQHAFTCLKCDRAFSHASDLKCHTKACSSERAISSEMKRCHLCPRLFRRPADLRAHIRTHTNEKPYKCCTCDRTFSRASCLAVHRRVHTGYKPYVCEFCSKGFRTSGDLNKHRRSIHRALLGTTAAS